ncbi:MAG: SPOR domain-containing protein [Candidatus Omnitrophica bacterium]|nr:SPOR domain-containing protein [Candidatus Omnitrophota bacterium]
MLVIFSFSMGIERGKRVALAAPASTGDAVIAGPVAPAVTTIQKADKGSEKIEDRNKDDAQKTKGVLTSSQTLVKNKAVPAVANVIAAVGGYTLQVASYKAEKFAKLEADKLKQKGFNDVYVLAKGAYTIVCVGNFQKKEDASDVKRQLKSRYQDFVVRRL